MRLHELTESGRGKKYEKPGERQAYLDKNKLKKPPDRQPGAGTGPDMQMPQSQIKVTPITMKNYRGGMARSMGGV